MENGEAATQFAAEALYNYPHWLPWAVSSDRKKKVMSTGSVNEVAS